MSEPAAKRCKVAADTGTLGQVRVTASEDATELEVTVKLPAAGLQHARHTGGRDPKPQGDY